VNGLCQLFESPPKYVSYGDYAAYLALIDAAERVLEYKCECARAGKHCNDSVYGPLRLTLKRIKDDKNKMGDGRG
jgi:hypothetical protein